MHVKNLNVHTACVFTGEIKDSALTTYKENFKNSHIHGDITKIDPKEIPKFDYLLAGFPRQPFSAAGNRKGFLDERGRLFFTIVKILKEKSPHGFLLENVEGLVNHDGGKTLDTILKTLKKLATTCHGLF
nr:DNA (cytosine-5-)-methyltransferase [Polynucleobacter necessarius]